MTIESVSLAEASQFLTKWYEGWDQVFLAADREAAIRQLSLCLSATRPVELRLPSGTVTSREEFIKLVSKIAASGVDDRHTFAGVLRIGPTRMRASVDFQRFKPVQIAMRSEIELELQKENGETVLTQYFPTPFLLEKAAVTLMMNAYLADFQSADLERTIKHYAIPVTQFSNGKPKEFANKTEVETFVDQVLKSLKQQNYSRSSWESLDVFMLTANDALVKTHLARFDETGKQILSIPAVYFLKKSQEGPWFITLGMNP